MEDIQEFAKKYNMSINVSRERLYENNPTVNYRMATGPDDYNNYSQILAQYEIKIGERALSYLIREDNRHTREMKLVKQNAAVRAAYEQYQLVANLCQNYYEEF